jgi:hypothetical protein
MLLTWPRRLLAWTNTGGYYSAVYTGLLLIVIGIADLSMSNLSGGLAFLVFAWLVLELRRRTINRAKRRASHS